MKKAPRKRGLKGGAGEYALGEVHTNTIEGVFSVFKRGMVGVYQHCGKLTCTATLPSSISVTIAAWRSR